MARTATGITNAELGKAARRQILVFLEEFVRTRQMAPTLADIAEHLGHASTYGAQKHLVRLEQAGLVSATKGGRRTTHLTDAGKALVASGGEVP